MEIYWSTSPLPQAASLFSACSGVLQQRWSSRLIPEVCPLLAGRGTAWQEERETNSVLGRRKRRALSLTAVPMAKSRLSLRRQHYINTGLRTTFMFLKRVLPRPQCALTPGLCAHTAPVALPLTPLKTDGHAGSVGDSTVTVPLSLAQPSSSPNTLYATGSISRLPSRQGEAFAVSAGDLPTGILAPLHLQQPAPSIT